MSTFDVYDPQGKTKPNKFGHWFGHFVVCQRGFDRFTMPLPEYVKSYQDGDRVTVMTYCHGLRDQNGNWTTVQASLVPRNTPDINLDEEG